VSRYPTGRMMVRCVSAPPAPDAKASPPTPTRGGHLTCVCRAGRVLALEWRGSPSSLGRRRSGRIATSGYLILPRLHQGKCLDPIKARGARTRGAGNRTSISGAGQTRTVSGRSGRGGTGPEGTGAGRDSAAGGATLALHVCSGRSTWTYRPVLALYRWCAHLRWLQ